MDTFGAVFDPPSGGAGVVFNPPPEWPVPPAGWQPPPGWQPDPSWPAAPAGWNFWLPGPADGAAAPAGGGSHAAPPGGMVPSEELKAALGILFPVRSWAHDPGWRQGFRLLVIAYA